MIQIIPMIILFDYFVIYVHILIHNNKNYINIITHIIQTIKLC
jgi:hypothetical protein